MFDKLTVHNHFYILGEKAMSQFMDEFHALLEKVIQGHPADAETKAKVEELAQKLTVNDATDAEQSAAILELTTKVGNIVPPTEPVEPTV